MRITALVVAAAALSLTACQKAEEPASAAPSEAVEAAGVADPAAVTTTIDQAAADAQAAAEAAVPTPAPAPAPDAVGPATPETSPPPAAS